MAKKKLFQVIAGEPELKGAMDKMRQETLKVFKGDDLFVGLTKDYQQKVEGTPMLPGEKKEVVTTVQKRLDWNKNSVRDLIDYELTRDVGNVAAKADVVVDGVTLATGVPVTFLLTLEGRLRALRDVYDAIPTLDMSKKWELVGDGIYKYGPTFMNKTDKKTIPVLMYPATKEHPAQVKEVVEEAVVGVWNSVSFSGKVHPGLKAAMLERVDILIAAVKDARMKANDIEVADQKIGAAVFDYIHSAPPK